MFYYTYTVKLCSFYEEKEMYIQGKNMWPTLIPSLWSSLSSYLKLVYLIWTIYDSVVDVVTCKCWGENRIGATLLLSVDNSALSEVADSKLFHN